MAPRPCLDCGKLTANGSRCVACARARDRVRQPAKSQRYDAAWQRQSRAMRQAWVDTHGWWCPGWRKPAHASADLVVDHDVGVLCRACNAAKANTFDRNH